MGQIQYVISIIMISLFTVAIIGFSVGFASDNNAAIDISDDPEIIGLRSDTESSIGSSRSSSESSYESIVKSSVAEGETLESGGTFSLTITGVYPVMKNVITVGYEKIFGAGNNFGIFMTGFISIFAFLGFMYFAKTWLGRNPD